MSARVRNGLCVLVATVLLWLFLRAVVCLTFGVGCYTGAAHAGDLTVQEAYPGSRLRPGSDANPYELRQGGRTLGWLEEESPPTRWLVPGSESNPYRVRPAPGGEDDGLNGFGAFDDDGDE